MTKARFVEGLTQAKIVYEHAVPPEEPYVIAIYSYNGIKEEAHLYVRGEHAPKKSIARVDLTGVSNDNQKVIDQLELINVAEHLGVPSVREPLPVIWSS